MKRLLFYVIILILVINFSNALLNKKYVLTREDGIVPTNSIARWVTCANTQCNQIIVSPSSNLFSPNPFYLNQDSSLIVSLPNCPETSYGYNIFFATPNFLVAWVPVSSYSCYYSTYTYPDGLINFNKKDNCQSTFTPNIQSCAEAGLPLTILTDTTLSADTASAFGPYTYYWPPELAAWDRVNTRMTIDIKNKVTPFLGILHLKNH